MTLDILWDYIPRSLKRRVATSAVKSLVRSGDFLVHDWLGIPSLERTIVQLIQSGWNPTQFVDVGAFEGEWTENLLGFFPKAHYLLIEAQPSKCEFLRKKYHRQRNCEIVSSLLGDKDVADVAFHIDESGSSLMRDKDASRAMNVVLPMTTLDHLTKERDITHVDLLKLDVQGAEMLVLQGSEATLVNTEFVLIELSFQELYDKAPLAISVINFMDEIGFQLYDLCSMMRRPKDKALAQIDALFVTRRSSFASRPGWR